MHPTESQFPTSNVKTNENLEQFYGMKKDSNYMTDDARNANNEREQRLTGIKNDNQRAIGAVPAVKIKSNN